MLAADPGRSLGVRERRVLELSSWVTTVVGFVTVVAAALSMVSIFTAVRCTSVELALAPLFVCALDSLFQRYHGELRSTYHGLS